MESRWKMADIWPKDQKIDPPPFTIKGQKMTYDTKPLRAALDDKLKAADVWYLIPSNPSAARQAQRTDDRLRYLATQDLPAILDTIDQQAREIEAMREVLHEAPCTCYNPDGSYPHDYENMNCYRNAALAKLDAVRGEK
jgi:hypothetical protein